MCVLSFICVIHENDYIYKIDRGQMLIESEMFWVICQICELLMMISNKQSGIYSSNLLLSKYIYIYLML